ncbi:DUF2155 domain-containing protein [Rhodobacterales bacterium HKCCSP123]|nr:DUF2155 domain-containing protein [Rhodobacterales bacterium HKCCSP123]
MRRAPAACLAGALALALATPWAAAQTFDNFDVGPLVGFEFDPDALAGTEVPSLGEDGSLPEDDGSITLDITEGQGGAELTILPRVGSAVTSVTQPRTSQGGRATLRALDRMLGRPTDVEMAIGETVMFGRIAIHVVECRFPAEDPASDAYAHVEILDQEGSTLFDGWMIASSPALNALEHPRYDVWVLGCRAG